MTATLHPPCHDAGAAAALAPMVEVWFRILADHVPDDDDRWCRACTSAGTGARSTPWPCSIRAVAESARERYATRTVDIPAPRRRSRRRRLHGTHGGSCPLTLREQEFLQLAADGCSDRQIALRLDLPERTVGMSIRRIGATLGVPGRSALLVLALREGVVV